MHESAMTGVAYFRNTYMDKDKILKVIDIGGLDINGTFKDLMTSNLWIYQGADIQDGRNVDIVLSNQDTWSELQDADYDVVLSGSTFEHMERPWIAMKEVERILRKGGYCCIIAPMIAPEHKFPVDCYRYMPDGMFALARWAGLQVIEVLSCDDNKGLITDTMLIARK